MYMHSPNYVCERPASQNSLLDREQTQQRIEAEDRMRTLTLCTYTPSPSTSNTGGATLMTTHGIPTGY